MSIENYFKIQIRELLNYHETPCDLYVALSDEKTVKVLNADEFYDEDFILKYIHKGVSLFLISLEEKEKWDKFLLSRTKIDLENDSFIDDDPAKNLTKTFRRVREYSLNIGINEDVVEIIEGLQKKSIQSFRKNKTLYKYLMGMVCKENYTADHSLLVSSVACAVAIKMSWSTQATLKKFVVAGLFHDLYLDDPKLAKVHFLSELETGDFTKDEKVKIQQHPEHGAKAFSKAKISCPNAEKIILHHHELPDGSGFPQGLDSFSIPPYVCLFIIAEEVVRALFYYEFKKEAWNYLYSRIEEDYSKGNFRKPSIGFLEFFKDKRNNL